MMPVSETDIYRAFLRLFNKLLEHYSQILQPIVTDLEKLKAAKETNEHLVFINQQITDLMRQHHALTRLRTKGSVDSSIYIERTTQINQQLYELRQQAKQIPHENKIGHRLNKTKAIISLLDSAEPMIQFDEDIFKAMIEKVEIQQNIFAFQLVNGLILKEKR